MKLLIISLLFISCSSTMLDTAKVASSGAATAIVAQKIAEAATPNYPLYLKPQEYCSIGESQVVCYLLPCKEIDPTHPPYSCQTKYDRDEFIAQHPKVVTLETSLVPAVMAFCEKNSEMCVERIAHYEGQTIVLEDK